MRLEPVIGVEVHVQLRTASKAFCGCRVEYGAPPNTRVCPVCLGLPGALPTLNARAVELGVRAALGLRCTVHPRSLFDRKSYFYPDLPKGYQVTQYAHPLATDGWVEGDGEGAPRVRIGRVHLEEDTAKSLHGRPPGATALDFNRAGVPLVEVVTGPDLRSPEGARAFLVRLKRTLEHLGVSDCSMEEGSLRVDASVSLRPAGAHGLGVRTEIKNLNSFAGVERALRHEIRRQEHVLRAGGTVRPETLLWDAARGEARVLRVKEEARDYRFLPEPDLPPLVLSAEWLEGVRRSLPELPEARAARFVEGYGLSPGHAEVLTGTRELADYYEEAARRADPREAAAWVMGEVLAAAGAGACGVGELRVGPAELAGLMELLSAGELSRPAAKRVFALMLETGEPAERIVAREGLRQVRDADALEGWVAEVVAAHPEEAERFRVGEGKLLGFFVGRVVRRSGGRADPKRVAELLREGVEGG